VGAGSASILIATAPGFTAVQRVVYLGERLRAMGWIGMALGFSGAALISLGEGESLSRDGLPYRVDLARRGPDSPVGGVATLTGVLIVNARGQRR
jgi:drug/metabolite transporter (DMT)-like permease